MSGVGISFGNTSAQVAIFRDGKTEVIANSAGERSTSTNVAYQEGELLTGTPATQMLNRQPQNVAKSLKSLVGRRLEEVDSTAQTCRLEEHNNEIIVNFSNTARKGVSALVKCVLENLKETSDSILGEGKHDTVISVPLSASPQYREIITKCATSAGFHVVDTIPEPLAALMAHETLDSGYTVVFRVGGKTTSATLVHVISGTYSVVDHADVNVGGQTFDRSIGQFLCQDFNRKYKCVVQDNARSFSKILKASEQVKRRLSTQNTSEVSIESVYDGYDLCQSLSRPRFETLIQADLQKIIGVLKQMASKHADKTISRIILSGGTCNVTKLKSLIKDNFPSVATPASAPEEVVSVGAGNHVKIISEHPALNSELEKDGTVGIVTCDSDLQVRVNDIVTDILHKHTPLPHITEVDLPQGEEFSLLANGNCVARATLPDEGSKFTLHVEVAEDCAIEAVLKDCSTNERTTILIPAPIGA